MDQIWDHERLIHQRYWLILIKFWYYLDLGDLVLFLSMTNDTRFNSKIIQMLEIFINRWLYESNENRSLWFISRLWFIEMYVNDKCNEMSKNGYSSWNKFVGLFSTIIIKWSLCRISQCLIHWMSLVLNFTRKFFFALTKLTFKILNL